MYVVTSVFVLSERPCSSYLDFGSHECCNITTRTDVHVIPYCNKVGKVQTTRTTVVTVLSHDVTDALLVMHTSLSTSVPDSLILKMMANKKYWVYKSNIYN